MREHNLAQINKDVGIPDCVNKKSNIWNNVIVVYKGLWETFDETVIKDAIKKVNNSLDIAKTHFMAVYLYQALKPDSPYRDLRNWQIDIRKQQLRKKTYVNHLRRLQ